ncbi:hypothetical protein BMR1_02g02795 [Babesia microti strain RI]|uniref:Uncharacterized protein n=1 Tax=Babesia microti (strain RI) TaxID=1133968 RepID=I7I8U8_BABMR|nr:hypothetical protein BMR1_02g02795 [Babesia microti strain RI]CCF73713.1 hypothetical protein BMR1_02g02795 [Babesia microti strain RI]|eukprot:XP_012648322.1 hypothetical protein BMR1_02g02795 [Babesia microti strain RI]
MGCGPSNIAGRSTYTVGSTCYLDNINYVTSQLLQLLLV